MKEKRIKLLFSKNPILDLNDYYEEYFDDCFYLENNRLVSSLKALARTLFRIDR
ncbi:MAG: hypothetical protein PHC56_10270 [Herbinix sp.]|nr:hypothetical protein [Herbinix sp.]